jgi:hypothetical protein
VTELDGMGLKLRTLGPIPQAALGPSKLDPDATEPT